jgi:hypothetical protein
MTIEGEPGSVALIVVGPESPEPAGSCWGDEYDYRLTITGTGDPDPADRETWSEVKALFR